ncbi:MAG: hypothetical protein M1570_03075 [Chloroflexi bacterium]|nr:hypothetical protein [Chloroflexota bacterium]
MTIRSSDDPEWLRILVELLVLYCREQETGECAGRIQHVRELDERGNSDAQQTAEQEKPTTKQGRPRQLCSSLVPLQEDSGARGEGHAAGIPENQSGVTKENDSRCPKPGQAHRKHAKREMTLRDDPVPLSFVRPAIC